VSTVDPRSVRRRRGTNPRHGDHRHKPIDREHSGLLELATALYERRMWEENDE
jgi:hypothetical protein